MQLTFDIAKRYLFGKKSTNAINIITWITMIGLSIGTAALIIILSVFNGFEDLLSSMFTAFNPDLKIAASSGKYFEVDDQTYDQLLNVDGVDAISKTVEEIAIFDYNDVQKPGIIKGVDDQYEQVTAIDSTIRLGSYQLKDGKTSYGIIGRGLAINLGVSLYDKLSPVTVHMPLRDKRSLTAQMGKEFKSMTLYPSATFATSEDVDVKYIVTNIDFVNKLLSQKNKISHLEVKLSPEAHEKSVRQNIRSLLGDRVIIENRYEQDAEFLKIMNIERWVSYLIACLVLFIIAFNMVGALWMMVLEKKKDISILQSLGIDKAGIRKIFLFEGLLIAGIGLILGIIIALVFYFLQVNYGLIGVPTGFMIDSYPIKLDLMDFIIVALTVIIIGFIASLLPAYRAGLVNSYVRMD